MRLKKQYLAAAVTLGIMNWTTYSEAAFDENLNEYTLAYVTMPETDEIYPIILKLIERNILKEPTVMEKIDNYDGYGVKHKLTNKAWKKLNKKIKKINICNFN